MRTGGDARAASGRNCLPDHPAAQSDRVACVRQIGLGSGTTWAPEKLLPDPGFRECVSAPARGPRRVFLRYWTYTNRHDVRHFVHGHQCSPECLSHLRIFGLPAMGIQGAGIGTIISSAVGVFVLAAGYAKAARGEFGLGQSWRFDKEIMGKYLRCGSPAGAEFFFNVLAFDTLVRLLHIHSKVLATAATITFNWDLVSFVPLIGIEIGVTSLVGRYMGSRDPDTAHKVTIAGLKMGLVYSVLVAILFVGFAGPSVAIYQPSDGEASVFHEAKPLAIQMLRLASIYVLVEALMVVFAGALRGAGDSFWAMVISVGGHWGIVAALAISLYGLNVSPLTAWFVVVVSFAIFCCAFWFRYRAGAWRHMQVVEQV